MKSGSFPDFLFTGATQAGKTQLAAAYQAVGAGFYAAAQALGDFDLRQIQYRITAGTDEVYVGLDVSVEPLRSLYGAHALDNALVLEPGQIAVNCCKGDIRMLCLEHFMDHLR